MNKFVLLVIISLCLTTKGVTQDSLFATDCYTIFKDYPYDPKNPDRLEYQYNSHRVTKYISKNAVFDIVQAYFPETDDDFRSLNIDAGTKDKKFKNFKLPKIECEFYGLIDNNPSSKFLTGYGVLKLMRGHNDRKEKEFWWEHTLIPITFSEGKLKTNSILVESKPFRVVSYFSFGGIYNYSFNFQSDKIIGYVNGEGKIMMTKPDNALVLENINYINALKYNELGFIISRESIYRSAAYFNFSGLISIAQKSSHPVIKHEAILNNNKAIIVRGAFKQKGKTSYIYSETKLYKNALNKVVACNKYSKSSDFKNIESAEIFRGAYYPYEEVVKMKTEYPRIGYKIGNPNMDDSFIFLFNLNRGAVYDTVFYVGNLVYDAKFSFYDYKTTKEEENFIDNNLEGITDEKLFAYNNIKTNKPKGYGDLTLGEISSTIAQAFEPIKPVATTALIALDKVIPLDNFFSSGSESDKSNLSAEYKILSTNNAKVKISASAYPNQFGIISDGTEKFMEKDYYSSITDKYNEKVEFKNSILDNVFSAYGYSKAYPMIITVSYLDSNNKAVSATIQANSGIIIEILPEE